MPLSRNALAVLMLSVPALAQAADPEPLTRAERSAWTETSTYTDVLAHLRAVEALPRGDRLETGVFARSFYGKPLPVVTAALSLAWVDSAIE